ncbi:MAG TPA: carboxylesterase/lipase family protein [Galbitalea sp.]|jgi:para-nitrobenzyl esterase|nr:carboxylesterase/lipase family protein [Galbitalea sp.]
MRALTRDELDVDTDAGPVRGVRESELIAWRGIPFARAPMGSLRFRAPRPATSWNGIRDASSFGSSPWQQSISKVVGYGVPRKAMSEDALTVNVLRQSTDAPPRPVLVYIYGGGNRIGTSSVYPGTRLVENGDVVYVTFNYRLGVFGFLDLSGHSTPGQRFDSNLGLRDQVAALEWVQRNIASFGGDPENVTIMGESAGALAVTTLLAVPAARGLFARAIAQSSPAAFAYGPERFRGWAEDYLRILGVAPSDVGRLRQLPAGVLARAGAVWSRQVSARTPGALSVGAMVDGDFLPDYPTASIRARLGSVVPLLIGTNANEGNLFARFIPDLATSPRLIDRLFGQTDPTARSAVIAAYRGYPGGGAAAQLGGDAAFWHPSVELAEAQSTVATVWSYRLDFATRLLRLLGMGATHATDTPLVFGSRAGIALGILGDWGRVRMVSGRMQDRWLSFVRTGEPGADWPRYEAVDRATLVIDREDRVVLDPERRRRLAWDGFPGYR